MQRIKDFVTGKMTCAEFERIFTEDPSIWMIAQSLLTPEIMSDDAHPFWSDGNRKRLESNNYSVQYACLSFGFDLAGRVTAHGMLGELLTYQDATIVVRHPPDLYGEDLREKLNMEYIGGAEVDELIDKILSQKSDDVSATKFITWAKKELRALFHLIPRKYPRWVQEPEWPMGSNSPMAFVSQTREGDMVQFVFMDVDTHVTRTVEQFY